MKTGYTAILISLLITSVHAQQLPKEERLNLEDLIEEIARNSDLDIDYTLLYEDLLLLEEDPININSATMEDLQRLRFLTEFQARNLISYILQHGPILSLFELQLIEGLDEKTIRMLLPFILIEEAQPSEQEPLLSSIKKGKHQLILRADQILEEKMGYASISDSAYEANPNSRYLGSPLKGVLRYRYHYKDRIYWGVTAEKDAGEEFFSGSNKQGFDFYSGHLLVNDIGKIKTLALGDYHLRFGQGLTLWSGISYGKTPYVLSIKKRQYGITKYSSTEENRFLRGVGTTISLKDLDVSALISLSVLYRDYQRDYYPFYSQAISENSTNKNERGLYLGTEMHPMKHFKLSAYFDAFWFPWLKYNVDAPSQGTDYMVRIDYNPSEILEIFCSLKEESKPRNRSGELPSLNEIVDTRLTKFRFQLAYWVSPSLQLRSRIELSRFRLDDDPLEQGYLVFQDILFRPEELPLSISFRYAMFDTDSWDTRIYAYEHDLLYAFSIPALHQNGMRAYLLVKYSPLKYMDLWIRLAQTYYSNVQSIGTGLDEISGKTKTELKVQMQVRF